MYKKVSYLLVFIIIANFIHSAIHFVQFEHRWNPLSNQLEHPQHFNPENFEHDQHANRDSHSIQPAAPSHGHESDACNILLFFISQQALLSRLFELHAISFELNSIISNLESTLFSKNILSFAPKQSPPAIF